MADESIPRDDARRLNRAAFTANKTAYQLVSAKVNFLDAVREYAPKALEGLAALPYEAFRLTAEKYSPIVATFWLVGKLPPEIQQNAPATPHLLVTDWAKYWNIDADWMRRVAIETVIQWYRRFETETSYDPMQDADRNFAGITHYEPKIPPDDLLFMLDLPIYNPFGSTRWKAEQRIVAAFKQQLKTYLDAMETLAESIPGAERAPKGRSTAHFMWLVEHQLLGKTYKEIALAHGLKTNEAQSIRKSVAPLAKLLSLPPPLDIASVKAK